MSDNDEAAVKQEEKAMTGQTGDLAAVAERLRQLERRHARLRLAGAAALLLAAAGLVMAQALPTGRTVEAEAFVLDYFRRSADHRLLFGGRVSYSGIDARDTGRATAARMRRVFPQLADVRLDYVWGGYVDISMNRAPDFGRIGGNLYYLQGFSGHGIAMAGMAGRLAAEAIAGQSGRFDLYGRLRHRAFPGGRLLRTPALVLGMLWYRLRDLL